MKKGINLQVGLPDSGATTVTAFAQAFAAANPALRLTIKSGADTPRAGDTPISLSVYIEGEQDAASDFAALAEQAMQAAVAALPASRDTGAALEITEVEHEDEDTGVILAPPPPPDLIIAVPRGLTAPAATLPQNTHPPAPPPTTLHGCPAGGDGHDRQLNARKNRTDTAAWNAVTLEAIIIQPWPPGIERVQRANWTPAQTSAVALVEGLPVQVEGWLKGAKPEGPESCNCHSVDDIDYHLWLVADPHHDRDRSVVVEVSPRVRARHKELALAQIRPLIDGRTRVRVSGWLMLDQEHPEQLPGRGAHTTRATLWEIHPIVAIEVAQGDGWVPLTAPPPPPHSGPNGAGRTRDPAGHRVGAPGQRGVIGGPARGQRGASAGPSRWKCEAGAGPAGVT